MFFLNPHGLNSTLLSIIPALNFYMIKSYQFLLIAQPNLKLEPQ